MLHVIFTEIDRFLLYWSPNFFVVGAWPIQIVGDPFTTLHVIDFKGFKLRTYALTAIYSL